MRRHIDATALKCGYGTSADDVVDELIAATPQVIHRVAQELPHDFPQQPIDSILTGCEILPAGLPA